MKLSILFILLPFFIYCQDQPDTLTDYSPKAYVYPNEVDEAVSLYGMRGDADEARIYNIEGQLIQSFTNIITWEVDVSGYMAGEYVLCLYTKGIKIDSLRFMKG